MQNGRINNMAINPESYINGLLNYFGYDISKQNSLTETPARVIKMYNELLIVEEPKITVFESEEYNQMIIDKGIPFYSLCEHHMIPFFGNVKIGYIPNGKIIGLSKLARIVNYFSHRLNTQEYMAQNIANYINEKLNPKGVGVVIKARHLCREMRGAKSRGKMITSALLGIMLDDVKTRQEFLNL